VTVVQVMTKCKGTDNATNPKIVRDLIIRLFNLVYELNKIRLI